ncbi:MAG: aminotransferase class V-fold PLP-dependent enzyme, partial [Oscillospiraceae bacterium]
MEKETKCLHSGYKPNNGEPGAMPIFQSTTYKYNSSDDVGDLFDLKAEGHMYSRISNPTVAFVEEKITELEGGVGALCTTSGQMANLISVLNILEVGDHFLCTGSAYGGTINLFGSTFKKFGIEVTFVDENLSLDQLQNEIKPNTKAVFGETITNPTISVLDIEKFAKLAHNNSIPLIVDNTFATPILCNPFKWGADIVTHSTTKYMEGHAISVGGVIVDSGNFDWDNGKFLGLSTPDESYHGLTYTKSFGKQAYITKARVQLMRDFGAYPQAISAFLLNLGLETLPLRIKQHSQNALKVAEFLKEQPEIEA